jgi:hypothetical protein
VVKINVDYHYHFRNGHFERERYRSDEMLPIKVEKAVNLEHLELTGEFKFNIEISGC